MGDPNRVPQERNNHIATLLLANREGEWIGESFLSLKASRGQ